MENKELKRTPCEVYSRVVGYLRPVSDWNAAKQAEYQDRKEYNKTLEEIKK
jgi:ribonucleoside-triphosphate reductase